MSTSSFKPKYLSFISGTDDEWISQSVNSELSVTIQNLNPAVVYSVKIVAENELGAGEPSEIITVKTEAEPPAKEPQDIRVEAVASDKLKLTWTAPERELWNGEILGYYVGYREYGYVWMYSIGIFGSNIFEFLFFFRSRLTSIGKIRNFAALKLFWCEFLK